MELIISSRNGTKIYGVKDDNGEIKEVTFDYVKYAIANGDLPAYYLDKLGNIFIPEGLSSGSRQLQYKLIGILYDKSNTVTGYLVQDVRASQVKKADVSAMATLIRQNRVSGAVLNERSEICTLCGTDEYQMVKDETGKEKPVKIVYNSATSSSSPYTKEFTCSFHDVLDEITKLEPLVERSHATNDALGSPRKYPDISLIRTDGIVLHIDGNQITAALLNAEDINEDITNHADVKFIYGHDVVHLKIVDTNYQINAFSLVAGILIAYRRLVNNFAKLDDVMISGKSQLYWSATILSEKKSETTKKSSIVEKTQSDIMTLNEMYDVKKSLISLNITPEQEHKLIRDLKIGTSQITITCNGIIYHSDKFVLNMIDQSLYIRFVPTTPTAKIVEIKYRGKSVANDSITCTIVCIVSATAVAKDYTINSVSINSLKSNLAYDLTFTLKSNMRVQLDNILNELN